MNIVVQVEIEVVHMGGKFASKQEIAQLICERWQSDYWEHATYDGGTYVVDSVSFIDAN